LVDVGRSGLKLTCHYRFQQHACRGGALIQGGSEDDTIDMAGTFVGDNIANASDDTIEGGSGTDLVADEQCDAVFILKVSDTPANCRFPNSEINRGLPKAILLRCCQNIM
jgi:hypothetical protein